MNTDKRRSARSSTSNKSAFIRVHLRLIFFFSPLVAAVTGFPSPGISAAEHRPPNIVVILADDFGVGDIHALYPSNKLATPNLDRLVAEGMHFTDAHTASAVCSPTRYGLLTGRYPWRTPLQEWVLACYEPPLIDAKRLTLPAFLKQHGYHTAAIGKWHLGWNWPGPQPSRRDNTPNALRALEWDFTKPIRGGPTDRGFDEFFGVDLPNFPPFTFIENDHVAKLPTAKYKFDPKDPARVAAIFDGAPMAPGWKFDEILPELTRRAVRNIQAQAKTNKPFFLYFAMTSPHEPIAPSKQFAGKSGIAPIADFLIETDWSAGQVVQAIHDAGIRDNTIVIFAGDNGHGKISGWDKLIKAGIQPSGPYRGAKGDIWEGGHRVPFIVRWPGHVAAGKSSDQLLCLNDLFATCAELFGIPAFNLPENVAEDSFSFLSTATGTEPKSDLRYNLVSHSVHGEFAYREDQWKIVFKMAGANIANSRGKPTVVELYNLTDDLAEKNNVAKQHPDIVQQLTIELQRRVDGGRSTPGIPQHNDRKVRFDVIQTERWAELSNR
jgi:arylsulfatase A